MAANLSKNGVTLMAAYKDVVDGKSDTNWALFTYEGDSNDIRLAEKGEGGLEEMVEELSSGKVMYAFCCVKDPNSGLPKYVLINWTGEGVKDSCKGVYTNHVSSMANFLKGAHVTVNARAEEDVDPATILAKVAKASGVNFNFHRKTTEHSHVPRGPVGSVYRKPNAKDDIQKTDKDRFWAQTQRDEDVLQKESSKRVEEEKQRIEREKKELEERQAKERQKRDKEKSTQIIRTRNFQKTLEIEKKEREQQKTVSVYKKINVRDEIKKTDRDHFWAQAQKEEEDHRKESRKRLEEEKQRWEREKRDLEERQTKEREKRDKEKGAQMNHNSFQKKQEMEKIRIMQQMTRTKEEKPRQNRIYQNTGIKIAESVQKANEAKLMISQRSFNPRDMFKQQNQQSPGLNNGASPTPQPGRLRSPFLSQNSSEGGAAPPEPKRLLSPLPPPVFCKAPCSLFTSTFPVGRVENAASPVRFDLPMASPSSKTYENDEPPVQPTDNIEDDWSDEFDDDDDEYDDFDGDEGREEALYEDLYEEVPPVEDHRLKARALYDYQAADHTEITFDPDDLITGIEMAGEGWWRGYAPNGHYGLFPANYVELLQQAPV